MFFFGTKSVKSRAYFTLPAQVSIHSDPPGFKCSVGTQATPPAEVWSRVAQLAGCFQDRAAQGPAPQAAPAPSPWALSLRPEVVTPLEDT